MANNLYNKAEISLIKKNVKFTPIVKLLLRNL